MGEESSAPGTHPVVRPFGLDWMESPAALDARAAAIIAASMRAVARADGMIHQREISLIASFEAGIPEGQATDGPLGDPAVEQVFLWSLLMTALADGSISEAERACIVDLALARGISEEKVAEAEVQVKRRFLSVFAGVSVFRDAVVRVARELGLSESEVDALAQEA